MRRAGYAFSWVRARCPKEVKIWITEDQREEALRHMGKILPYLVLTYAHVCQAWNPALL